MKHNIAESQPKNALTTSTWKLLLKKALIWFVSGKLCVTYRGFNTMHFCKCIHVISLYIREFPSTSALFRLFHLSFFVHLRFLQCYRHHILSEYQHLEDNLNNCFHSVCSVMYRSLNQFYHLVVVSLTHNTKY